MRYACGVEVGDNFIVTGGMNYNEWYKGVNNVTLYSRSGFVRRLASMNTGRRGHGCTTFVTETGDTVRIIQ